MFKVKIGVGVLVLFAVGFFVWSQLDSKVRESDVSVRETFQTSKDQSRAVIDPKDIRYTERMLAQEHTFDKKNSSPIIGSAVADINNDGIDEIFIGGGHNQNDVWYQYENDTFIDITDTVGWKKSGTGATYGTAVIDYDNDADADVFVARVDGVFYYENKGKEFSNGERIDTFLEEKAVPTGMTLADLNNDGNIDMFVSTYLNHGVIEGANIFNKEAHGTVSKLLLGSGGLKFEDVTEEAGLNYRHNTFAGTFADLDGDLDADLVVAYDTGSARIYENQGNVKFRLVQNTPWQHRYGYPMGIGIGDINNDGLSDLYFSNTGSDIPEFLLRGDLRKDQALFTKWTLYRNQGNLKFEDASNLLDLKDHEFAWGGVIADIDNNGKADLVVSENYIKLPQHKLKPHPGRVFLQDASGMLRDFQTTLGAGNPYFSLSSLLSDWNEDGILDIAWVNIDGKSRVYMSSVASVHALGKVTMPLHQQYFGSHWRVEWDDNTNEEWNFDPTEGMGSTQSNKVYFLLGNKELRKLTVTFSDGKQEDGMRWYEVK